MSVAKPKLRELALELDKLSWAEVKAMAIQLDMEYVTLSNISAGNQEISDRIVCTMDSWLKTDPKASWKRLIRALKSTNKIVIAELIEKKYVLNPSPQTEDSSVDNGISRSKLATSVNSVPPPANTHTTTDPTATPPTQLAVATTTSHHSSDEAVKSKPTAQLTLSISSVETVQSQLKGFHRRFKAIKELTINCLEACKIAVLTVVFMLTEIRAVDHHKVFLEEKHKTLRKSEDHWELFGLLNLYWDYLAYDLLDQLIEELIEKNKAFESIAGEMAVYKNDLEQFRKQTTLEVFCQAVPSTFDYPPPGFIKMIVKFDWPNTVTLENVELFRKRYACKYNLKECAMILNTIGTGSFTVTWFIPVTVIEILLKTRALDIIKEFSVTRLEIDGRCVYSYRTPVQQQVFALENPPSGTMTNERSTAFSTTGNRGNEERQKTEDEDYPFVEQPSDDFFCPVTTGLLLKPHLTSCCGKHLSQEAAVRIQKERRACPLCKTTNWSTMLNRHFQRQVNELHVFCRHEDRGCGWHGELSELERHIQSCPMRDGPLMTDLLQSPLYKDQAQDDSTPSVPTTTQTDDSLAVSAEPQSAPVLQQKLNVHCFLKETKTPRRLYRGSATTDNKFSYFISHHSDLAFRYEWKTAQWTKLPSCPFPDCALVIISGELTTVGGYKYDAGCISRLYTLLQRRNIWTSNKYPPGPIACHSPAVVSTFGSEYIIVIGGVVGDGNWTDTVKVLQVKTRKWYQLTNIPQPLQCPSATICGNQLHVIGNANGFTASLQNLPSDDQKIPLESASHLISWTPLPRLPVLRSTAATLHRQLVIIGGWKDGSSVNSIHQLVGEQWVEIGSMSCARCECLVVSPSPDSLMIVGGVGTEDSVEECFLLSETQVS